MIPKRLKEAREAANFSQEKLAQLVDIESVNSRSRISNYESGRFTPSFEFIQKVAKVLDYPEGYFYTSDDDFAELILTIHRGNSHNELKKSIKAINEAQILVEKLKNCLNMNN
ncbi:helix-turn-helix domain-containing protein [Escherichia albertii]|uniref:helix-turn-helix domain-containing protein n=1 Tax=Escherichia albertii TaxID=208962 RepID=UPI000C15DE39|nr:helix-turn-helix transcriptional regulator [Escherichia albertii]EFS3795136.1 helix-turn-helix transcriptional regulator [Escherichia coli]EKD4815999.1 helix-turn-helix transcriptional regulator [Escherichia albertii]